MAIAINGSGTVTGISVGGLPDGIVDTDMLAAAAVTEPKRGAGAVLQVSSQRDNTRRKFASITSNAWQNSYTQVNTGITPKRASSILLFDVCIHYGVADSENTGSVFWQVQEDKGGTVTVPNTLNGDTGQTHPCFSMHRASHGTANLEYNTYKAIISGNVIPAADTASRTYTFHFRIQNGDDVCVNRDGSNASDSNQGNHSPTLTSHCRIIEVAQ